MQLQRQTNLIGGVIGGVGILVALTVVRCIDNKDKDDKSALFKAAEHGNAMMVKLLLTLGANPNIFVSTNHPIHAATTCLFLNIYPISLITGTEWQTES